MKKTYMVYSYRAKSNIEWVICNPDHDYKHKAKGVTVASGFKSEATAIKYIHDNMAGSTIINDNGYIFLDRCWVSSKDKYGAPKDYWN